MYNPFEDPVPDDPIQRAHAFARDLAYGVANGSWSPEVIVMPTTGGEDWSIISDYPSLFAMQPKWSEKYPYVNLLVSLGYLQILRREEFETRYILTAKAFALLDQAAPASIFISYKRSESSLLALLVLARLKAIGLSPFLDMQDIEPGAKWEALIKEKIEQSDHLVCLLARNSLDSEWVRREIKWSLEKNSRIIPIWHNGFDNSQLQQALQNYPEIQGLEQANAIEIKADDVEAYNNAMIKLVNYFGVTPT